MKRILLVVGMLAIGLGAVSAQQDVVAQRQKLMKDNGKNLGGVLGGMVKGEKPYDQAAVDAALTQLDQSARTLTTLFPDSTKGLKTGGDYDSSPKIWENRSDFDAHFASYSKAIGEAKTSVKDLATLKAAVPVLGKQCSGCHETYRLKNT
ncbi:MAG: cytochrome C [Rhizobiales bacterium 62-47]|nr:cytochrome c [Hyphomicrobiales bacterium]OJY09528.1 MAG: cytochrome C [Rhizobiales bacterium 62-47]